MRIHDIAIGVICSIGAAAPSQAAPLRAPSLLGAETITADAGAALHPAAADRMDAPVVAQSHASHLAALGPTVAVASLGEADFNSLGRLFAERPSVVPTPGSLSLLAFAGLIALRRRERSPRPRTKSLPV